MQRDEQRLADTRDWVARAVQDLRAAQLLAAVDPPLLAVACYHCQQAAEKVLKAFLYFHDTPFRRTHALDELADQCVSIDAGLDAVTDEAIALTPFSTRFRYPGAPADPTPDETAEAIRLAEQLVEQVVARLPGEARP